MKLFYTFPTKASLTSSLTKMKNYSLTKLNNFNMKLPRVKILRRKDKILTPRTRHSSYHNSMSNKTKDFLHKLCNKKTPPVDMTQYGFVNDRRMNPTATVINPLKAQLNKLIGRPTERIIIPRTRPPVQNTLKSSSRRSYGMSGGNSRSVNMYSGGPGNKTSMSIQAGPQKQNKKIFG